MNRKNTFTNLMQKRLFILIACCLALINIPIFSFGQVVGPGGVVGVKFWIKSDDVGPNIATSWKDHSESANPIEAKGTWTLSPADAAHNFYPYTTGYSSKKYFRDTDNSLVPDNTTNIFTSFSIFSATKANAGTLASGQHTGRIIGIDNNVDNSNSDNSGIGAGEEYLSIDNNGYLRHYKYAYGELRYNTSTKFNGNSIGSVVANQSLGSKINGVSNGAELLQLNGIYETFTPSNTNQYYMRGKYLQVGYGTWDWGGSFPGDIMEVMWFLKALTPVEQRRVDSYLAVKNGVTMGTPTKTFDYLNSDGNVIWDGASYTPYQNNIFGIGRDDASGLHQRVSNSTNGASPMMLTVATSKNFTSPNTSVRTGIGTDKAFLMFGDNNNTITDLLDLNAKDCPAIDPDAGVKRIQRVWLVQPTGGSVGGVFLNAQLASYKINSRTFMLVADDANFTQNVQKISAAYANSYVTASYEFKTKKYITFGGEFDETLCPACENGQFTIRTGKTWWDNRKGTGNTWTTNSYGPYTVGFPDSGNIRAKLEILDPAVVEWRPQTHPGIWGSYLWLRRWNSPDPYTYSVSLTRENDGTKNKVAAKASFRVLGITANSGGVDVVTIKGYCNGVLVFPKITKMTPNARASVAVNGNVATGANRGGGYTGSIYVNFEKPVDKIDVIWTQKGNKTATSDLWISDYKFTCPEVLPPNADAVSVKQEFTDNEIPSCKEGELKFTFVNENCDSRSINLSEALPSGLTFVSNSYNDNSLPAGSIQPVYSGQNVSFTGLTIPSGTYEVYFKVQPSAAGDYNTQGNYTVTSSGNKYNTIGDSNTGVVGDNAKLVVKPSTPVTKPDTMYMTVNKTCYAVGDTLTYTVSFNNSKGVEIPKVKFENFVDSTKIKILAGSLNTTFGGVANSYGGSSYLEIDDMTLPIGGSSIMYKAVVLSAATDTVSNQAAIYVDPTSECGGESASLSTLPIDLLKCLDCSKPTGLGINNSSSPSQKFCANSTITLQATCPSGSTITWYKIGTSNVKLGTGSPFTQTFTGTTTYGAACEKEGCVPVFDNTNKITATAYPIVAAPTNAVSSAGTTAICVGASTNLSATCSTGTTVVWYIGTAVAGTGSPLSVSPTTTTTYTANCRSTDLCESTSTSANEVIVKVNPVVSVPTGISSSKGTSGICLGDSSTLSATCASGSSAVWYIGTAVAGTGSPLVVKPTTTTTYTAKCKTTDTACESASTSAQDITVAVLPVVAKPTGISSSAGTTICAGTSTNISATCASGSSVVWYSSGAVIGTLSTLTITPSANVTYTAKCRSTATSCESASTSAEDLSIIVTPIPTAPTGVTAANSTICPNGKTTVSGNCATGSIQWYIGSTLVGTTSPLTVAPLTTTTYSATCKSSVGTCESAQITSSDVTVTVSTPSAPTGLSSSAGTSLCTNNTNSTLEATCASGNTVKWYVGTVFINSGKTISVAPLSTTTYTATCLSGTGTCESSSAQITLEVSSCVVPAPVISSNPSTVVPGQSTTLTSTACTNGTITWYKNGVLIAGVTGTTYGSITVAEGEKYTAKCTINNITSPSSNEIAVPPVAPAVTPKDPIVPGQQSTFKAEGCTNGTITWYKNGVLIPGVTGAAYGPVTVVSGDSYTAVCTVNNVPSSASTPVVVPPAAPAVTPKDPIVPGQQSTFKAEGCTNGTITWYKNGVLIPGVTGAAYGPVTAVSGDSYTAVCTVNNVPSSASTPVVVPTETSIQINAKVFLQGPLSGSYMTTALNTQNLIPLSDPYGKGTTTTSSTLTGNSVTDWVLVELRNGTAGANIIESKAALLSNDGTLRNPDGTTPLKFNTSSGSYFVAVRHRNHLGVMTANQLSLNTTAQTVDFTSQSTPTYQAYAQKTVGSVMAMWAGNTTGIGSSSPDDVRQTTTKSDAVPITNRIAPTGTTSQVPGYYSTDVNMDGVTRQTTLASDRLVITNNIATHPNPNAGGAKTFVIQQSF